MLQAGGKWDAVFLSVFLQWGQFLVEMVEGIRYCSFYYDIAVTCSELECCTSFCYAIFKLVVFGLNIGLTIAFVVTQFPQKVKKIQLDASSFILNILNIYIMLSCTH